LFRVSCAEQKDGIHLVQIAKGDKDIEKLPMFRDLRFSFAQREAKALAELAEKRLQNMFSATEAAIIL
jgi:hypothetical protein